MSGYGHREQEGVQPEHTEHVTWWHRTKNSFIFFGISLIAGLVSFACYRVLMLNEWNHVQAQLKELLDERNQLKAETDQLRTNQWQLQEERDLLMDKMDRMHDSHGQFMNQMREEMAVAKRNANGEDDNSYYSYFTKTATFLDYAIPLANIFTNLRQSYNTRKELSAPTSQCCLKCECKLDYCKEDSKQWAVLQAANETYRDVLSPPWG
ncbi:uncharacterized protein [Hyperolius riggenbachi]|uniref:uncharacterized protein n=1 Tax=Hyperolius riggenbachi TaxID=752182 RepID=UPI0035A263BA